MLNANSRPRNRAPKLDAINDVIADDKKPRRLHPTKGFRRLNVKRDRAAAIVASIKNGWSMDEMRRFLRDGI